MKFTKGKLFLGLLVVLILIQFIRIDKSKPAIDASKDFFSVVKADQSTKELMTQACYDCHSYETTYPWYSDIAPVSFWLQNHVKGARKKMNFATWKDYDINKQKNKLQQSIEAIETKWMPLNSYAIMHPKAKLDDKEREVLVRFFKELQKN